MSQKRITEERINVELVRLRDEELVRAWQEFQMSGMPDMLSAMNLCLVLQGLASSGILENLKRGRNNLENDLLPGINDRIGRNILRYLVLRGIVEEWEGSYFLTRKGELLTSEISMARLGFYVEAYGRVTEKAGDLLTGKAVYGDDVHRNNGPLSKHTGAIFARYYSPIILETIRRSGATHILDLGCGSGQLLVDICLADAEVSGVGIDIAPAAVELARNLARDHGLQDRLSFEVADAFVPATWPSSCSGTEFISSVGVLHEQFRAGEQAVVDILDRYADFLTGDKMLLIGEPEPHYDDRENDSDFFLMHVLTNQGLPVDRTAWLDLFGRTRLTCRRVLTQTEAAPRMCFYELVARD